MLVLGLAALLSGCGGSSDDETTTAASPTTTAAAPATTATAGAIPRLDFDYNASVPLAYVDNGRVNKASYPIAVHDVAFQSRGQTIEGYLLVPPGKAKRPAVVLVHGSGGDRADLIGQAAWLAARNVVTLTLTEPSTAYAPVAVTSPAGQLRQVRDVQVRDVVAVRRAVDVLRTLPQVDPERIGYLGWSAGAKTGALVAAVGAAPRRARAALGRGGAAVVVRAAGAGEAAAGGTADPRQHRPAHLRRPGASGDAAARERAARRDRPALRAAAHGAVGARGDAGALVRRNARPQRGRVSRRLRVARGEARRDRARTCPAPRPSPADAQPRLNTTCRARTRRRRRGRSVRR